MIQVTANTMRLFPEWSPKSPQWSKDELDLLPLQLDDPPLTTLQTIIEKSDAFPCEFPIETVRCKSLKTFVDENILERNAKSAYPIIHENILHLCAKYILHKRQYGNEIERAVYNDMNLLQLINRLLTKRAVYFFGVKDFYRLLTGEEGNNCWEIIGTPEERKPLVLEKCLSYEEIKLSAFLSVSSYTDFVNVGNRYNCGIYNEERDGIEDEGVIIGIVGPRLDKQEVMDSQELIITASQNVKENGYGRTRKPNILQFFANLYEEDGLLEFKDLKQQKKLPSNVQRYSTLKKGGNLDNFVYYKRLLFPLDILFIEANQRAVAKNTTAYILVASFGLEAWMRSECQSKILMDSCKQRLQKLGKRLHNVSDICFSWIRHDEECLDFEHVDTIPIEGHPLDGIKTHIFCKKDEPHSRLTGDDQGKLLVVSYAGNGNALPGGEFWRGYLVNSATPAAAPSTQISELHNPFINPRVCASNLRVIVGDKMVHIKDYIKTAKKRRCK